LDKNIVSFMLGDTGLA